MADINIDKLEIKLTTPVFYNMVSRKNGWIAKEGKNPNLVYLNKGSIANSDWEAFCKLNNVDWKPNDGRCVSYTKMLDMGARVAKWKLDNPNEVLNYVWVTKPSVIKVITLNDCLTTTLQLGSTGNCVSILQQKLQDFGLYTRQVDGDFGTYTKNAVIVFQGLTGHTQDGICGPKTWSSVPTYQVVKPGVLEGDAWVLAELRKRGVLNTISDLRNIIVQFGMYLFYYNQQQSQYTTVTTLKANCADWINDVGLPIARALGLKAKGVHCQVLCSDGVWYGHYIMEVEGVLYDVAGWAKGKGLYDKICSGGYEFLHYEGNYIP